MGISQIYLLAFISVLSLARAQTATTVTPQQTTESVTSTTTSTSPLMTPQQTTESVTSTTTSTSPLMTPQQTTESVTSTTTSTTPLSPLWQTPETFYPFGSAAGDTQTLVNGTENFTPVNLSSPFQYFGRQYHLIYVNNNGLLSFTREIPEMNPFPFPYGGEDLIAPLWTELDDYGLGAYYYQEYTSGHVLTRATQDINSYYPGLSFTATWVFVATWDFVNTWDTNVFSNHSAPSISVQVVLISDGSRSFILMNYGDVNVIGFPVEAGYDTISSTHYFVIPGSTDGNFIPNLKYSTNVNVQGRWAFSANQGIIQFTENFYPVGLTAGDYQMFVFAAESVVEFRLYRPFLYFGRSYNQIYVNNNGLLSFSRPIAEMEPLHFSYGNEDLIAPLWTDLDDFGFGIVYYQEYTSGHVLTRATEDINSYYPGLSFQASWVFVATWDFVQTYDENVFYQHAAPIISFQVVLISDGSHSFILMNYGDIAVFGAQAEAGYGTIGSTHYFVIPGSNDLNLVPNLKNTTNVHIPGRWAFMAYTENVVGLQMKVTSYLDLIDTGNLAVVLEQIKNELVNRGLSSDVQISARRVKKTP
ncbi:Sushi, nidogen and EGF-like domain-containing protein 1 [Triplophysa tibetana]|uniref:Sushi, nidogen and EGF-like domain-containing protein 1 n=1 Tax=Triplophysa tibetana TaxID=1572043 RepID=A0A5A9PRT0_9TELE|nr:Sushi, nidogen and EGF-like domain-containing protein 1 [Triplophysa tibetana]